MEHSGAGNTSLMSEDCLFAFVATPKSALEPGAKKLPVVIWIHGGGNVASGAVDSCPDGLVKGSNGKLVVVSINYRLGLFGFLGSAALKDRAPPSTGNYGIQDQRAAMKWVKDHIHAFGGDGEDITIAGQSAGAGAVLQHLVQPESYAKERLYSKAIMESIPSGLSTPMSTAEDNFAALLKTSGCSDVDCLVKYDALNLTIAMAAAGLTIGGSWGVVQDNVSLTAYPYDLVAEGKFNRNVRILLGSTRDESAAFTGAYLPPTFPGTEGKTMPVPGTEPPLYIDPTKITDDEFVRWFKAASKDPQNFTPQTSVPPEANLSKVLELYNESNGVYPYPTDLWYPYANIYPYVIPWFKVVRVLDDKIPSLGACSVRWWARRFSRHQKAVYSYLFAHPPVTGGAADMPAVPHDSEIKYAFMSKGGLIPRDAVTSAGWNFPTNFSNATEFGLAQNMSAYWQAFALTGEPNPSKSGLPAWPAYSQETDTTLRIDIAPIGIQTQTGLRKDACDYWESVYCEAEGHKC